MRIGIDLGGTKISGIALDSSGRELARRRIETPRGDYDGTLAAIARLVASLEAETVSNGSPSGVKPTVGVGMPGAISPATGLVKNANSTWLNGRPFDQDLARVLSRPVRVANDANCLAVSEATDGAAAGAGVVFAAIVGTGVGGGIAIEGRVLTGGDAIAGEWGHNPLPWPSPDEIPGPACYCGRHGCIETFLSGPALARDHAARGGKARDAREVVARAAEGDAVAQASLFAWEDRLARGLATVINLLDPEVIVLGGGLSRIERLYENVPARLARYVFSDRVATRLVPSLHGDDSGVRGAAWLWPDSARL